PMNFLFRLKRYGVVIPRLLAAGQKHYKPWQTWSFLLIERLSGAVPLPQFLAQCELPLRRTALRRAGEVLRQMHHASCYLDPDQRQDPGSLLAARGRTPAELTVALATVHGIAKSHYANPARARRDLASLSAAIADQCAGTDLMRGFLAYLGRHRLNVAGKRLARQVLRQLPDRRRGRAAA